MNKQRSIALILLLGAALLVHGNGKTSFFARITGMKIDGGTLRIDYTNAPGHSEVWLGATNDLRQTNTLWTLIATNTQTPQQTSNAFLVDFSAVTNAGFFRLLAPGSSLGKRSP